MPVINAWVDNKYVMGCKFFDELGKNYDIDEECFEEILNTTIEDQGVYVISYIVALELFNIYKKNKKEALELFKKFLKYPANEDILTFVVENISINEHASEEAGLVLSKFNKELKKRRY
jgi:predicted nucleic acid-binding protein